MISAYEKAGELRQAKLHEEERPVSMIASILVNQSRDPKKSKPLSLSDFYLYQSRESQNLPSGRFGSAAVELVKRHQYPAWALFCFKELSQSASGSPPSLLAYIGEDCMLLAPIASPGGYTGLLLATESASDQVRELSCPEGKTIKVKIPLVETKVVAEEDVFLRESS